MSESRILQLRPVPYKDSVVPRERRMQYLLFKYFVDAMRTDSPSLRFGVVVQLQLVDRMVLCGIGRSNIPADELAIVDTPTWDDAFEDNSTVAFTQKLMLDAASDHTRFTTPLEYLYHEYLQTELHSPSVYDVPAELLALVQITEATDSEHVSSKIMQPLLETLLANG